MMRRKETALIITLACALLVSACGPKADNSHHISTATPPKRILVFAAASLTDVVTELAADFETRYGIQVKTNMASSGTLARQMSQGGAPHIYISASAKWANYVDSLGYIVNHQKSVIAQNQLVLIAPHDSPINQVLIDSSFQLPTLQGKGRLSMGDPLHVPAGKYAKQALNHFGWYASINKQILPAKDVRSALMVVELGEAPLGIVYRTDALKSKLVKVLGSFPPVSHQSIVYVAGVCNDTPEAQQFYSYLQLVDTKAIWQKHGFMQ